MVIKGCYNRRARWKCNTTWNRKKDGGKRNEKLLSMTPFYSLNSDRIRLAKLLYCHVLVLLWLLNWIPWSESRGTLTM